MLVCFERVGAVSWCAFLIAYAFESCVVACG